MSIAGSGFLASHAITLQVEQPDKVVVTVPGVSTNASGAFSAVYNPPGQPGRYRITASDGTNSASTAVTAGDAIGFDLKQCAQDDSKQGQPLGLGFCNWIGSSLGANNSTLYEGIATEQQLLVTGMSGPSHTMIVGIQATKGGNHAYDFLVSDAQSTAASAEVGITLQLNRCGDSLGTTAKAACNALVGGGGFFVDIPVPDDSYVSHDGPTQAIIDAYETHFGNRTVRLYSSAAFVGVPTMTLEHRTGKSSGSLLANGADTGDSYIWYTITWTSDGQDAMLAGAADIALGGDGTSPRSWGAGTGASGINGDPYHFYLISVDGTGGSLDNQMASAAVLQKATLTIVKKIVNDDGGTKVVGDFSLTTSAGTLTFGAASPGGTETTQTYTSQTFTLDAGTYTFSEANVAGYTEGTWSCSAGTGLGSAFNAGSITLGAGNTATCEITNNDQPATLTIVKKITNDDGGTKVVGDFSLSTDAGT
ncbi:MAG: hypothetical protein WC273_11330, partial [Dehalococcoidia bacterium]